MIADSPLDYGELQRASRLLLSISIAQYPKLIYLFKVNGGKLKIKWLCRNRHEHLTKIGALICQFKGIK